MALFELTFLLLLLPASRGKVGDKLEFEEEIVKAALLL